MIRDGREETVVTEDTHVEQDNDGPEELRDTMQEIIDQFIDGKVDLSQQGQQQPPPGGAGPAIEHS